MPTLNGETKAQIDELFAPASKETAPTGNAYVTEEELEDDGFLESPTSDKKEEGTLSTQELEIAQMKAKLDALTANTAPVEEEEKGDRKLSVADLDLSTLITEEELSEGALNTVEGLHAYTRKILALAQEMYYADVPQIFGKHLARTMSAAEARDKFWADNGDLEDHQDMLKDIAMGVQAANPGWTPIQIYEETGKKARQYLGLSAKALKDDGEVFGDRQSPASVPRGGGSARGRRTTSTDNRAPSEKSLGALLEHTGGAQRRT